MMTEREEHVSENAAAPKRNVPAASVGETEGVATEKARSSDTGDEGRGVGGDVENEKKRPSYDADSGTPLLNKRIKPDAPGDEAAKSDEESDHRSDAAEVRGGDTGSVEAPAGGVGGKPSEGDTEDEARKGQSGGPKGEDKQNASSIFAVPLVSSSEYVCPFSKLLEKKGGSSFLEVAKPKDASLLKEPYALEVNLGHTETTQKSWDIKNTLSEDETLLFENKACSLSHYRDTEWSTPIPVVLQLIGKKDGSSKRFVCYQVGTGRLQLNTTILPTMSVNKLKTKSIIFSGQLIADESKLAPHRVIFQDQIQRDACHKHF